MFAWVGSQLDSVLNTYVVGVVSSLMTAIAPVALTTMTLWVGVYGWAVLRHEVSETIPAFVWKVFKIGLVLAIALQSGLYISTVADAANALATGVASTFLPDSVSPQTISSPYALLDDFFDRACQQVVDIAREAGLSRLDLWFAAGVTATGNVIFACLALYVVTLAKVFLTFTIAVGPLFVLTLAWRPTAKFFDSWLSMLLNAVVLAWFTFFALGLSTHIGERIVLAIQNEGGLAGPAFNPMAESLKYCVVMILMAFICFQAPSLASGLTGGPAVQQGVQMIQNVLMVSGMRSHHADKANPAGAQGGVAGDGTGIPYSIGRAAGVAVRAGKSVARTAAYKLAALRGRT